MENAPMLVTCRDPDNPGVKRSGELGFTNYAPSADILRESFKYLSLDWGIKVPWNAIPWTKMGEKDHDLDLVRERGIIPALLKPTKGLRVVVLLGKGYAWTLEREIHSLFPDEEFLTATTRVTRVSFPKWGLSRPGLIYRLREELEAAKEYAEGGSPGWGAVGQGLAPRLLDARMCSSTRRG